MARRRKNPTKAQWVVLGVGGAIGLGLLGYGVAVTVRNRRRLAGPWQYTLHELDTGQWVPTIYEPGGRNPKELAQHVSRRLADGAARSYIERKGGTPVYRSLGQVQQEAVLAPEAVPNP